MDPDVAERQRRHFQNKHAPHLRKVLLDDILKAKVQAGKAGEGSGSSNDVIDSHVLTPTFRAYVMRPAACRDIPMKRVLCFTDSPSPCYGTVDIGTSTYLLAMSRALIKERCPAWNELLIKKKKKKKSDGIDHSLMRFKEQDAEALEIILKLVHYIVPDVSELPWESVRSLTIVSTKLEVASLVDTWFKDYLSGLKLAFECGLSSVYILGWPLTLRLSAEFRHRDMFTLASRHFIRRGKLLKSEGNPWLFGAIIWESRVFELNQQDLFADTIMNNLGKREGIIGRIWTFLHEKQAELSWWKTSEAHQMAARKLRKCQSAFHDAPMLAAHCRGGVTGFAYTNGSVDDIIAYIEDIGVQGSDTADATRDILGKVAKEVDGMVTARLHEMEFLF
ncbi:hypothetical protein PG993_007136 [Apiospora rasikravindrae]|uniref:Uncharacterized protein n=1 Tax=Apiospora rasikravindrae TaxID=990691 RepID=A0ABR1SWN2_9PEZI